MLEIPRIFEPRNAPAFGGFLAWLRGCGLAFFLELWYGRALYRQMVATMAVLDRMLLAFRAGSLPPVTRETTPAPAAIPRPRPQGTARAGCPLRRHDADGSARSIAQTTRTRLALGIGSVLRARGVHRPQRRAQSRVSGLCRLPRPGFFQKSR